MVTGAAIDWIAGVVGAGGMQTGVVATLAAAALYVRKFLGVGSLIASWLRSFAIVAGVLALLLVSGVVEGVDLAAAWGIVETIVELLGGPIRSLVGGMVG